MKNSIERVALFVFLVAMIICAILALLSIWGVFGEKFHFIQLVVPSLFVIGLASFLIWIVLVILSVREKILGKK